MEIGVIVGLCDSNIEFHHVKKYGLSVCQLACWDMDILTDDMAQTVNRRAEDAGVRICAYWAGWPGYVEWNFTKGPITMGLVPEATRRERVDALKKGADFAAKLVAPAIITHCGFIPENMTDANYPGVVAAIKEVAEHCESLGLGFWFETGQETPVVLLRTIEQVGTSNLGINLDPANLLLYGKGNPIDALDVFGQYVRNIHVKDGFCPTDGNYLGKEAQVGKGIVRFPEFISKLKEIGFDGELIIEREISGDEQIKDIHETVGNLKLWLSA